MDGRMIMGTELEYGIRPDRHRMPSAAAAILVAELHGLIDSTPGMWVCSDMLSNGARLYLDGGHPEYATPECADPLTATLTEHAGPLVMGAGLESLRRNRNFLMRADELRVYRNNCDSRGAFYGYHENYQIPRPGRLDDIVDAMVPFLATRQIWAGAGRVLSDRRTPFHLSQRALAMETVSGTQSLRQRPVFNTRDEPHADRTRFQRIHLINGDVNMSEVQTLVKLTVTGLLLDMVTRSDTSKVPKLDRASVVPVVRSTAADLSFKRTFRLSDGKWVTALELQSHYRKLITDHVENFGFEAVCDEDLGRYVMAQWDRMLTGLGTDFRTLAPVVDWVHKWNLVQRYAGGDVVKASSDRARMIDLQFHDIRPEASLAFRGGRRERLFSHRELYSAAIRAPVGTRAELRSIMHDHFGDLLTGMSWERCSVEGVHEGIPRHFSVRFRDPRPEAVRPLAAALRAAPGLADAVEVLNAHGCISVPLSMGPELPSFSH